jgi:hypothetical protein
MKEIKARRVRWLVRLFRTSEYDLCRMLIYTTLHDSRRAGQPPVRWLESVEEDFRKAGVGIWKRMFMDREKWRSIIGTVKAGNRLQNQKKYYIYSYH